jgi:sec-independent protein translocase protein TatB
MLSLPHLIIVFVVALVVFGPEKLPELAKNVGKFMAEFRRMTGEFKSTFEGHMRELEREADERKRTPVAATPPPPPTENTIRNDSPEPVPEAPVETAGPIVKAAEGIVPSADPRSPVQKAEPQGGSGAADDTASTASEDAHSSDATANAASAEETGETPEPVTDGQHYPD